MRVFLWAAIVGGALGWGSVSSQAFVDDASHQNTITEDDEGSMVKLIGRAVDISKDLTSVMVGFVRSGAATDTEEYTVRSSASKE